LSHVYSTGHKLTMAAAALATILCLFLLSI
jgi:hypothetical protein